MRECKLKRHPLTVPCGQGHPAPGAGGAVLTPPVLLPSPWWVSWASPFPGGRLLPKPCLPEGHGGMPALPTLPGPPPRAAVQYKRRRRCPGSGLLLLTREERSLGLRPAPRVPGRLRLCVSACFLSTALASVRFLFARLETSSLRRRQRRSQQLKSLLRVLQAMEVDAAKAGRPPGEGSVCARGARGPVHRAVGRPPQLRSVLRGPARPLRG